MSNHGGHRAGAGKKHALKTDNALSPAIRAAIDKSNAREVIHTILSEGAHPAEIMMGAARYNYERFLEINDRNEDGTLNDDLVAKKQKFGEIASVQANRAAPYVMPKLASIEWTGLLATARAGGNTQVDPILMELLTQLSKAFEKSNRIRGAVDGQAVEVIPPPQVAEDVVADVQRRYAENVGATVPAENKP